MNKITKNIRTNGDSAGLGYEDAEFVVMASQRVSTHYNIFLDNTLSSVQEMRFAVSALTQANEEDTVTVHLSTNGGSVDSGLAFLNAMRHCKAPVEFIGSGTIASMGFIILCDAERFQLEPFTSLMAHSVSFGYAAEAIEVAKYAAFTMEQSKKMLAFYCCGVLTKDEIDGIFERKDTIWMSSKEFSERWQRKQTCQDIVLEICQQMDVSPADVDEEMYVQMMYKALEIFDAEDDEDPVVKEKKKPVRKPRAKKEVVPVEQV